MAGTNGTSGTHVLIRFFATYRLFFYLGGLIIMSIPLGLSWVYDIEVSGAIRTVIVAMSFTVIVATYIAERQYERLRRMPNAELPSDPLPLRQRIGLFLSLGGLAAGIYMVLTDELGLALVFLAGSGLFFQQVTKRSGDSGED